MKNDSDKSLWQRAIDGDHPAFGVIFERHVKRIYEHCFRRVASWSMAEDLTSVVFLEAWRKRENVHFVNDSALPWLLGVATNICRNAVRSLRSYKATLSRLPEADKANDALESDLLLDRLHSESEAKVVLEQLSRLSDDDRVLIELAVFEGLGYEEISTALGIPIGTVRSRLSRARGRLKERTTLNLQFNEEAS